MLTKDLILQGFKGRYSTIQEITEFASKSGKTLSPQTIIWSINDLIRQGKAWRVGRGAYSFNGEVPFELTLSDQAKNVCSIIDENFTYLKVTVMDTTFLNQFMNLQPFTSVITLETDRKAADAVVSTLLNNKIECYSKQDFQHMERYIRSTQPVIVCPDRITNPTLRCKQNLCYANLEKILVDLVCDEQIFGQYQGDELENIFINATSKYTVNYSKLLKYAQTRKRRKKVEDLLDLTEKYQKVRSML